MQQQYLCSGEHPANDTVVSPEFGNHLRVEISG
jgi:hypothetical protein